MPAPSGDSRRRHYHGKILYIGDEEGERGREWFDVTVEPDGTRTLRAKCEIDGSEVHHFRVLRDVIMTVDADWRPLDAFVRITVNGAFMGSAWFLFDEHEAQCEGFTVAEGRFSQTMPLDCWTRSFGCHPVVCDIWHLGGWDWTSDKTRQGWPCLMSSPLSSGASGPMLSRYKFAAEYLGDEAVTVPAGTFQTKHFVYPTHGDTDHEPEHVWYAGEDLLFVKIRWDHLRTTYELVEFAES